MHRRIVPWVLVTLSVLSIAPAIAHADRTPSPQQIDAAPPIPPPTPVAPAPPAPAAPETKHAPPATPATVSPGTPAPAKQEDKGGMCRVGAPTAGWELLVLAGLGLSRRRRG